MPDLSVGEIDVARDFFVEVLGFDVGMDMGSLVTLVSPSNPTAQITLQTGHEPDLTIEVDDVDQIHRTVRDRGLEIVYPLKDEDWGVRRFFVRGPGGAVINVMMHHSTLGMHRS